MTPSAWTPAGRIEPGWLVFGGGHWRLITAIRDGRVPTAGGAPRETRTMHGYGENANPPSWTDTFDKATYVYARPPRHGVPTEEIREEAVATNGYVAPPASQDTLLTPSEVATKFRVDPKTVTRWAAAGRIGSIRTPGGHRRFRESEVRWLLEGEGEDAPEAVATPGMWPAGTPFLPREVTAELED